jgi:2-polyprenyl-3-methyl-5-hydroxy-6-metoxy-1,4-benzoquinol methylase
MRLYLEEMESCHGAEARAQVEAVLIEGVRPPHLSQPLAYPLNLRLAQAAEAIIVHSEWSRSRFERIVPATPTARINMHALSFAQIKSPPNANGHQGVGMLRIAAFGHVTPEKGIERTFAALAWLKQKGYRFHFTLVGEASPFFNVEEFARECGLGGHVTITGYVSLEEFKRHIAATDIAINLRERTVGETSASLCRIMCAGVPAIVSNVGWFSELPNDSVVKIDLDEHADALLRAYLERLFQDAPLRAEIGANARRHMLSAHTVEQSANDYISFIKAVIERRVRRRFVQGVSQDLAALGITERDGDFLQAVARSVAEIAPPEPFTTATRTATAPRHSSEQVETVEENVSETRVRPAPNHNGRLPKLEGIDYKQAACEYPRRLDAGRRHYLLTKPFDNLATRPPKYLCDGMDVETHRHFCDFANLARQLALPSGSRILDVGCGSGWLSEYFARLGYDVCGIDISPDLIEMARERLRRVPFPVDVETPLRYRFETHDIEEAPLDETFDAIICYDSLHHFERERAVIEHLSMMLDYGGLLFILEGDRPQAGSKGERELLDTMSEYGTLESPFSRDYLDALLKEKGFLVIGDYASVNGFFERALLEGERVPISAPELTYLLCKKVTEGASAAHVRDSRQMEGLRARLSLSAAWPGHTAPGALLKLSLSVENTGETVWLTGPATLRGAVTLGLKVTDTSGDVVFESHGVPPLPRALAKGESSNLALELHAPPKPGTYKLKIDLIAQHVCWFEQAGSAPLVLPLNVR